MAETVHLSGKLTYMGQASYWDAVEELLQELDLDPVVEEILLQSDWRGGPGVRFEVSTSLGAHTWMQVVDVLQMLATPAATGSVRASWGADTKRFSAGSPPAARIREGLERFIAAETLPPRAASAYRSVVGSRDEGSGFPLVFIGGEALRSSARRRWRGAARFEADLLGVAANLVRMLESREQDLFWDDGPTLPDPPGWWGALTGSIRAGRSSEAPGAVRALAADVAAIESLDSLREVLEANDPEVAYFVDTFMAEQGGGLPDVRSSFVARLRLHIIDSCRAAARIRDVAAAGRRAAQADREAREKEVGLEAQLGRLRTYR